MNENSDVDKLLIDRRLFFDLLLTNEIVQKSQFRTFTGVETQIKTALDLKIALQCKYMKYNNIMCHCLISVPESLKDSVRMSFQRYMEETDEDDSLVYRQFNRQTSRSKSEWCSKNALCYSAFIFSKMD